MTPWSIRRRLFILAFATALLPSPVIAADAATTRRLHAFFDAEWQWAMRTYPEWATFVGEHRHGDRLRDASAAGIAAEFAHARQALTQARAIPRAKLSSVDATSLDIFIHRTEDTLRFEPFVGLRSMSLGALSGFHSGFADLLRASPVATRPQAEQMLARMKAYPRRVEQELARLREGLALRWVPPKSVLDRVLAVIDGQLAPDIDKSAFFEPFTRLGKDIAAADQDVLRSEARRAVEQQVLPALRRLRAFVVDEYLPAAPAEGALAGYPGGVETYAAQVKSSTTTDLAPAQIHAIGLRELERLRAQMEAVQREVKFEGSFAAFVEHLNTDPKFFHASPEALLAGYCDIAKRIDPELPKLFAVLPRASYGVRAMPAHKSSDSAEYYNGPALDGSTPGWFNANAQAYRKRPIWSMETLVAHEGVPGHHLQIARSVELGELPKFRRGGGFSVYGEGWALYAETLGFELGLYTDPYSRFGHLQDQALRAARLVVDTGMHALGWSRQRRDRLHGRAHRQAARLCQRRGRPLPVVAGPGADLHARPDEDRRTARPRQGEARTALRHPPLPRRRARRGIGAAAGAGTRGRCVDHGRGWPDTLNPPRCETL